MTRDENKKPRGPQEHRERVIEAMRDFFGNKRILNKGHRQSDKMRILRTL